MCLCACSYLLMYMTSCLCFFPPGPVALVTLQLVRFPSIVDTQARERKQEGTQRGESQFV